MVLEVQKDPVDQPVLVILLNHLDQPVLMDLVDHLVPAAQLDLINLEFPMVLKVQDHLLRPMAQVIHQHQVIQMNLVDHSVQVDQVVQQALKVLEIQHLLFVQDRLIQKVLLLRLVHFGPCLRELLQDQRAQKVQLDLQGLKDLDRQSVLMDQLAQQTLKGL